VKPTAKILLLGSGELGREFTISAKRLGCTVVACDSYAPAAASAVVLADRNAGSFSINGLAEALALGSNDARVDVRVFGKPVTRPYRRMAVALATGSDCEAARALARAAAAKVEIRY
jgi:phosphoribosylglycinamide formyltransferase 2